ncbi:integrase catalytic domain-containing protein [Trichonephila clavipes]|nr:integrase catalytic domain-containing protein [Trichonephila clavipes]
MNEYLALGHMHEISQKRDDETPNCYIPNHMVTNEKSTTTKCRVVFNASSKTKNGKSLNDVLMTGPKLQTEIFNHLIKFRSYRVAFAADIEKLYRQILILDEDCSYQRIVWRATPSDSLKSFELQTITYGTSCAPFLALRMLQQLYQDEEQNFLLAAKIARENIYIDDLLLGADTEVETKSIIIEIQNLLKSGGFIFRKWSSSHPKVLQDLDTSLLASKPLHSLGDEESKQRVLGFCDASTKAYAAVVYLKSKHEIHLVSAKTRVAPIKQLTIPRLELCEALLLAELISVIQKALRTKPAECFLWTDSTIVLSWLMKPPIKENIFVKNRITKILNLTSTDEWHHIPGKLNPADCATRGLSSQQLMNADYWWKGPDWINNDLKEELASAKILTTCTVEADSVLNSIPLVVKSNPLEPIISKFSNFTKLIRVIALCKRFINNCKSGSKVKGQLKSEEVESGHKFLVKTIQQAEYSQEISHLKYHKPIPRGPVNYYL